MFRPRKGFSFLEMLIVIMIVGILFVAFRSSFQVKNKDLLYGQACIETVYGEVNNFLHAAISSKSVNSWWTAIFPDRYIIAFDPSSQTITLGYETQNTAAQYESITISGNSSTYCNSNAYAIMMSGERYAITIAKGLEETQSQSFFSLSWTASISTGEDTFLQCNTQGNDCKTIARFETDTRTIIIKKQMCLTYSGSDCLERDN